MNHIGRAKATPDVDRVAHALPASSASAYNGNGATVTKLSEWKETTRMAFVICEPCVDVKDTACVDVCPVDCIYEFEGANQLYIHPVECIDCAACEPECPVEAIFPDANVPSQWQSYIDVNRTYFDTHPTDTAVGRGGAATSDDDAPAEATRPAATAKPVLAPELDALRRLLTEVNAKKTSASDALDKALPLLEKLGVKVTDD